VGYGGDGDKGRVWGRGEEVRWVELDMMWGGVGWG
jgi:hypothetical protein